MSRFLKPPCDPGQSDFPSPVLTSALHHFSGIGLPPHRRAQALARIHPIATELAYPLASLPGAYTSSSMSGYARLTRGRRVPRAPLPSQERYSCRGDLTDRLRERYLSIIAPTGSCARPCPSPLLWSSHRSRGLRRFLPGSAATRSFPTLSLHPLRRRLDPYPTVLLRCSRPVLPQGLRPRVAGTTLGGQNYPCNATSTGSRLFGAAVIRFASSSYTH